MKIQQNIISKCQAAYYFLTGIWPILHMHSFIEITGAKTDLWLVKMVGLLTVCIAITLFYASRHHAKTALILGVSSAASYAIIDVYYATANIIPGIYLADAVLEVIIIILLLVSQRK